MARSHDDAQFSALRDFLRGYFHQDLADEYGSPKGAASQFAKDSDNTQRRTVAQEWSRFLHENRDRPLSQINELLRSLGCSWNFDSLRELEEIETILKHK